MNRQLMRTAVSGTDREEAARRLHRRHRKAGGPQAALADHASHILVGGRRNATAVSREIISVRPVASLDQSTAGAPLRSDEAPCDSIRNRPDRPGVLARAPRSGKPGTEKGRCPPRQQALSAVDTVRKFRHGAGQVGLENQSNAIRHQLYLADERTVFAGRLGGQYLQPGINGRRQHTSPTFRAPNRVAFQAENRPRVGSVAC